MSKYLSLENQQTDKNTELLDKLIIISTANSNFSSINDEMKYIIDKQQESIYKYKLSVFILIIIVTILSIVIYKRR